MSEENKLTWRVTPTLDLEKKTLLLETTTEFNELASTVNRQLFDTNQKMLRDALILLGWTPPKEENESL